jgi:hypothetical protein
LKKFLLLTAILFLVLYGCNKSEDSPVETASSPINGNWQSVPQSFSSINNDSLSIDINLTENNNVITGNGGYTYIKKVNYTSIKVSVTTSDISGKFNSPSVSFIIPSAFTSDSCKFSGSYDQSSTKLRGTVEIINSSGKFDRSSSIELIKK